MDVSELSMEEVLEDSWSTGFIAGYRAAAGLYPNEHDADLVKELRLHLDIARTIRYTKRMVRKGMDNA